MKRANIITLLGVLASALCNPVYASPLSEKIDALIKQKLPLATVAVYIKDAQTDKVIYSKNADNLLSPASAIKLFTAAAALYQLSPSYQYKTTLSQKAHNVYLTFEGAPDLNSDALKGLLDQLKQSGRNSIQGNIVIDISRFKPPYYSAGISYDDLGWYYAPPETALILDENAVPYDFVSAEKFGQPIQIKAKTPNSPLTIINQVKTVSKEQEKDHCKLTIQMKPNNTLRLYGCLAKAEQTTMKLVVPEPLLVAKRLIAKSLQDNHITLKGQIITGRTPADAKIISFIQSGELSQLISHMLKTSDNLYANSISRTLGFMLTKEGSTKQATFAMKQILSEHAKLNVSELELADGIGTRYNLTSAKQIVALLTALYQDKTLQPIIINALPQSAVSGSLQERMKTEHLKEVVFAKTGTMHDISSLSGYLLRKNAHPIIFSIIINGVHVPINTAKLLEEQILESLP